MFTTASVPEIALASGLSTSVPFATGTIAFDEPIYIDQDTDYSNEESHFVIGTTVHIQASIFGGTDDVSLFFSLQQESTLNDLDALPEDVATDLWVNDYTLADGESIDDVFYINFITPQSSAGNWLRFRWEARWFSLGIGSAVSENTIRLNLVDQIAPTATVTPIPTPTPQPTDQPTHTPTATNTPTFTPTPAPTEQQIVRQFYLNRDNEKAVKLKLETSQYSGGSKEILSATNYYAFHDYDGTLKIFATRQVE